MLLTGEVPDSEFDLRMGSITLHLKKTPEGLGGKEKLFEIENWEHVSASSELHEALVALISTKQIAE